MLEALTAPAGRGSGGRRGRPAGRRPRGAVAEGREAVAPTPGPLQWAPQKA